MSSVFAAIKRLMPLRATKKGFAGYDLQGNSYFELPNPAGERMKRSVEYKINRDLSEYTRGENRPPVQWRAWLSHTREKPPTLDELKLDFNRQASLQPKIAAIEAREREERIRQGYLLPDGSSPEAPPQQIAGPSTPSERRAQLGRIGQSSSSSSSSPTSTEGRGMEYQIPTPAQPDLAPPRETIDPSKHASAEELRKLAEEDTKRRIAQSEKRGVQVPGQETKARKELAGESGLQPRRRRR